MPHEFDLLKQWGLLNDAELQRIASQDTVAVLDRVTQLLGDELNREKGNVAPENFVPVVREMLKRYREGSWQLGEAIIEAGELADRKAYADAKEVYEKFLSSCPWKFYRDIARTQLNKLDRQS
jgi:hypothetical protein